MGITTSNIPAILQRLERWQEGLPGAVREAFAPAYWTGALQMVAREVLQTELAQWSGEVSVTPEAGAAVMGLVQNFVEGIRGRWEGAQATYAGIWEEAPVNLQQVLGNLDVLVATGQYAFDLDPATIERAKEVVAEWVATEKILSEQDDYDVGTATERVQRILGLIAPGSDAALAGWLSSSLRQYDAGRLGLEIGNWLDRQKTGSTFLTPALVEQWLAAVLVSWREYARLHVPDRLTVALAALARRSGL